MEVYVSPLDMKESWLQCIDNLGYPNNQPKSNCGTYEEAMDYMYGEVTEWIFTMGFFLAISMTLLLIGYRRKRTSF